MGGLQAVPCPDGGIRDHGSTHWIYACAYQTRGLSENDYLRLKFSDTDILKYKWAQATYCQQKLEYFNIRGKFCEDCFVNIGQGGAIFHVSSHGIDCGGLTGLENVKCGDGKLYIRYFGAYDCYDNKFACSTSSSASTQLWFAQYIAWTEVCKHS